MLSRKRSRLYVLLVMAAVPLLETASASQQNAPQDAALVSLRQAADRGDPIAQTGLAFRLMDGRGMKTCAKLSDYCDSHSPGKPIGADVTSHLETWRLACKDVNHAVELYRAAMERPDADYPT